MADQFAEVAVSSSGCTGAGACCDAVAALRVDLDVLRSLAMVAASTVVRASSAQFEEALRAEHDRLSIGVTHQGVSRLLIIDRLSELFDEIA